MRKHCAFGVDKTFKYKWQAAISSFIFNIKIKAKRSKCKHDYFCQNIYIGAHGERNVKLECRKCGDQKWDDSI